MSRYMGIRAWGSASRVQGLGVQRTQRCRGFRDQELGIKTADKVSRAQHPYWRMKWKFARIRGAPCLKDPNQF